MTKSDLTCEMCGRQKAKEADDICEECRKEQSSGIPKYDDYYDHNVSGLIEE